MDKKLRVFKLRDTEKNSDEVLQKNLDKLKEELSQLRVAKVAGGTASKLGRIRVVRKSIAKYLTVINQRAREKVKATFANKKFKPTDCRGKRTRSLRQKLTRHQLTKQTVRQWKRSTNFPLRKYALRN